MSDNEKAFFFAMLAFGCFLWLLNVHYWTGFCFGAATGFAFRGTLIPLAKELRKR